MTTPEAKLEDGADEDGGGAPGTGPEARRVPATGAALAARRGADAVRTAEAAKEVADVIAHTTSATRLPTAAKDRSAFLREEAARVAVSTGRTGGTGSHARVKGHLFDKMDRDAYNAANAATGKLLAPSADHRRQAYDVDRFVDGVYAGSGQQKSSAAGVGEAVRKIERKKAGSATPSDGARPGGRGR